ncbi:NAD-dependent epimerase/dehydratase family protein [Mycolicibacterium sp. XJ2546]
MRVVVVGATGNVGTSVVEVLAGDEQVDTIVGIARRRPKWQPAKTTWVEADISRHALDEHFRSADAVVHLAWLFQPTHDELATWTNNVLGAIRVFDAVARAGVGVLVYASSVGAYSPGPTDRGVDETWPTHALPTAAYGREKSYLERVLDAFERDHPQIRVVRLRPGFIFKRESASEQRRLFAGPLLPRILARPSLLPIVPDLRGLRLQALHSLDAAHAFRLAVLRPVHGAFNVAADPVVDPRSLGELLGARPVKLPVAPIRAAVAAAWRLHLVPASPTLFDLALSLPIMDTTRARTELGWTPSHTALEAIGEFLEGLRAGGGMATPPLDPNAGGRFREKELLTGVGQQATP